MAFDYEITADAKQALEASRKVEISLEQVEKAASRAGAAMASQLLKAAQKAKELDDALTGAQLGKGFEGLADHFRREAAALERIRGPAREHEADLRALVMLYQRGTVSAAEYHAEVDRLNNSLSRTPKPGVGSQIAGGIGEGTGLSSLAAGGVAGLAAAGAGKALEFAHEVGALSEEYTNLDNRLRRVTKSDEERAMLMSRTKQIANETRMEWAATGETFVRLTNATKDMNLGQDRTLHLTETINKAFAMSGASSSEASAGMLQLSQAFSSGRLQGDEFRTLAESVPDILDMIAKQLHVSRGELKQLGTDGKITSRVLVDAFEAARTDIDAGFSQVAPTLSAQWVVFKNEMTDTIGKLVKDSNLLETTGNAITSLASAINTLATAYRGLKAAKDFIGGKNSENPTPFVGADVGVWSVATPLKGVERLSRLGKGSEITEADAAALTGHDISKDNSSWMERAAGIEETQLAVQKLNFELMKNTSLEEMMVTRAKNAYGFAEAKAQLDEFLASTAELKRNWETQKEDVAALSAGIADLGIRFGDTSTWGDAVGKPKGQFAELISLERAVYDQTGAVANVFRKLGDVAADVAGSVTTLSTEGYETIRFFNAATGAWDEAYRAVVQLPPPLQQVVDKFIAWKNGTDDLLPGLGNVSQSVITLASQALPTLLAQAGKLVKDPWFTETHHHGLSLEQKLLNDIRGPMIEYGKEIKALDHLLRDHKITTSEYTAELDKMAAKLGGMAKLLAEYHAELRKTAERGQRGRSGNVTGEFNEFLENPHRFDPNVRDQENARQLDFEEKFADEQRQAAADRQGDLKEDEAAALKVAEATLKWRKEIQELAKSHDVFEGFKKGLDDIYKEATDVSTLAAEDIKNTFHGLEDVLVNAAQAGKFAWGDFLHQLEHDLLKLALRILEMRAMMAILNLGSGGTASVFHTGATQAFTGLFGGAHADGGSYTVPGSGGPDSRNVMFRLTPGERVDFTPPGVASNSGVTIVNKWDPRELLAALSTADGHQVIHNAIRTSPAAFRQILRK